MSGPAVVYRTADPATVEAFRASQDAVTKWTGQIRAHAHSIGGEPWVARWGNSFDYRGVVRGDGQVPEGWRYERGKDYLVPKVSTRVGKAADAAMAPLRKSPSLVLLDMPDQFFTGLSLARPGAVATDDHLTVLWSADPPIEAVGEQWERMPLSAYYAEREAATS